MAAVILGIAMWAASNVLVKLADTGGVPFAFYRLWIGFVALALVGAGTRRRLTMQVLRRAAPGGVLFGINIALFFASLNLSSVANVTLIAALQPAFVLIAAGRFFGERVGRREVTWTVVSLAGVALVVFGSSGTASWSPIGDGLAFAAVLIWSVYFMVSKHVRATIGTVEYFSGVLLVAGITLIPVMLVVGRGAPAPTGRDWILMTAVALGPGTGGHLLINWAHRYVDVSVSSLLAVAQPPLSAIAAAIFLSESITALQAVGGAVTLVAVAAVVAHRREPELEVAPEGAP